MAETTDLRETEKFDLLGYVRPADATSAVLRAVQRKDVTLESEETRIGVIPEDEEEPGCECRPFELLEKDEQPSKWTVAVVGGIEHAIGGWSDYEVARRRYHVGGCCCYRGRTYVTSEEAVASILRAPDRREASGGAPPLEQAAGHLAATLAALEKVLCEDSNPFARLDLGSLSLIPLAPEDIMDTVKDEGHDPGALLDLAERAEQVMTGVAGLPGPLPKSARSVLAEIVVPPASQKTVSADDAEAVRSLEAEVAPRAGAIERYQGAVAELLEKAATHIDRVLTPVPQNDHIVPATSLQRPQKDSHS